MEIATVQDVSELLRPAAVAMDTGKTVLIGDVDYGDVPQLAANPSRSAQGEDAPTDRFTCLGGHFQPLSGTASELDAVHESVLGPVERLQGSAATPDAVRKAIDGASHIHFATHGYFVDERCLNHEDDKADALLKGTPLARSGLALSGANDRPTSQGDGLLSAEELLDLDLTGTQLVVLSACDTGRGETTAGQGVMGLRSALSLAGARNQVVSLWPIPDAETSLLMTDFYDALGPARPCRKCTVAGALGYAQRRALKRQRASGQVDVRSWAAFEASGND
ncbi:MAG: CHAT domain-containing protein [Myxococcota bacterium]